MRMMAGLLAGLLLVSGCSVPGTKPSPVQWTTLPELTPSVNAELEPAALEYFWLRRQAVVAGEPGKLWGRYPQLERGSDPAHGINAEAQLVQGMQGLEPFDGNFSLDAYGRLRGKVDGDTGELFVHGTELFLFRDSSDRLSESGGELLITLYLQRQSGRWNVVKTDEVTLGEYHEKVHD
jgi:hypothetical protein